MPLLWDDSGVDAWNDDHCLLVSAKEKSKDNNIWPGKQIFSSKNWNYFLTRGFIHVFWVPKRTVSSRRFF